MLCIQIDIYTYTYIYILYIYNRGYWDVCSPFWASLQSTNIIGCLVVFVQFVHAWELTAFYFGSHSFSPQESLRTHNLEESCESFHPRRGGYHDKQKVTTTISLVHAALQDPFERLVAVVT